MKAVRALLPVLLSICPSAHLSAQDSSRIAEAQSVLSQLIESYGVSGMETPVRATVQKLLPAWAKTETDTAGNLWVRVGQGDPVVVFVAHLDEIGYRVDSILDDGSLRITNQGGFFQSLFEAEPALVHTPKGDVPGVFLPRDTGTTRHNPPPLRVTVGATSRPAALALGVTVGSTITMPKQFVRLAGTRATGRSMDDRVGDAAQILALRHLDRSKLKHQVIFVFSTREEIGLEGARAAATARWRARSTIPRSRQPRMWTRWRRSPAHAACRCRSAPPTVATTARRSRRSASWTWRWAGRCVTRTRPRK